MMILISGGYLMLVLIRGISGSGKSTLAKTFESVGYVHLESDMYMIEDN